MSFDYKLCKFCGEVYDANDVEECEKKEALKAKYNGIGYIVVVESEDYNEKEYKQFLEIGEVWHSD